MLKTGRLRGNPCLLVRMFVLSTQDGVSHMGGHKLLTMQGDPYNRFLIHGNPQQLCTRKTLVIWLSLAQYIIRKLGVLSVILARVFTSCTR
jgi:hypothetical protein